MFSVVGPPGVPAGPPHAVLHLGSVCAGMGITHFAADALCKFNPELQIRHAFACEIDEKCQAVLRQNCPNIPIYGDLHLHTAELPAVDVVVCGFPCQPYSAANRKRLGVEDPRADVLPELISYVERTRPKALLLENVPGFLSVGVILLQDAVRRLQQAGYRVAGKKLDSARVGAVPQRRVRLYLLATLEEKGASPRPISWPTLLPPASLCAVLGPEAAAPGSWPSAPSAKKKVLLAIKSAAASGLSAEACADVVVNCHASSGAWVQGRTPCLTAARGSNHGFWLLGRRRMMSLGELLGLQGMAPGEVNFGGLSDRQAGTMIGNGFTKPVILRLLARLLPAAGLSGPLRDPYDAFSLPSPKKRQRK